MHDVLLKIFELFELSFITSSINEVWKEVNNIGARGKSPELFLRFRHFVNNFDITLSNSRRAII